MEKVNLLINKLKLMLEERADINLMLAIAEMLVRELQTADKKAKESGVTVIMPRKDFRPTPAKTIDGYQFGDNNLVMEKVFDTTTHYPETIPESNATIAGSEQENVVDIAVEKNLESSPTLTDVSADLPEITEPFALLKLADSNSEEIDPKEAYYPTLALHQHSEEEESNTTESPVNHQALSEPLEVFEQIEEVDLNASTVEPLVPIQHIPIVEPLVLPAEHIDSNEAVSDAMVIDSSLQNPEVEEQVEESLPSTDMEEFVIKRNTEEFDKLFVELFGSNEPTDSSAPLPYDELVELPISSTDESVSSEINLETHENPTIQADEPSILAKELETLSETHDPLLPTTPEQDDSFIIPTNMISATPPSAAKSNLTLAFLGADNLDDLEDKVEHPKVSLPEVQLPTTLVHEVEATPSPLIESIPAELVTPTPVEVQKIYEAPPSINDRFQESEDFLALFNRIAAQKDAQPSVLDQFAAEEPKDINQLFADSTPAQPSALATENNDYQSWFNSISDTTNETINPIATGNIPNQTPEMEEEHPPLWGDHLIKPIVETMQTIQQNAVEFGNKAENISVPFNFQSLVKEEIPTPTVGTNVPEIAQHWENAPIKDLRKSISINERYLFINELFKGDEAFYEKSIKTLQNCNILPEATYWVDKELKTRIGWNENSEVAALFDHFIRRRFS